MTLRVRTKKVNNQPGLAPSIMQRTNEDVDEGGSANSARSLNRVEVKSCEDLCRGDRSRLAQFNSLTAERVGTKRLKHNGHNKK